jgi:hypothetical protein
MGGMQLPHKFQVERLCAVWGTARVTAAPLGLAEDTARAKAQGIVNTVHSSDTPQVFVMDPPWPQQSRHRHSPQTQGAPP